MTDSDHVERLPPERGEAASTTSASALRRPLAVGLTVVTWAVLLDAAVETYASASPVRWWVAGPVAGYLTASVLAWRLSPDSWRRFGWERRAVASCALLLGLTAFTAWLPGGLSNGLALLREPTSTVMSGLTTVAVGFAAIALIRSVWLPAWSRGAAAALALYGIAAFIAGIWFGTPYAELLRGASMWSRLPFWLQGAFLGALVVVPSGLLFMAVPTVLGRGRPGAGRWSAYQVTALTMSVVTALSGVSGPAVMASKGGGAPAEVSSSARALQVGYQQIENAATPTAPGPALQEPADGLTRLFSLIDARNGRIPRDTFDTGSVVTAVGPDPLRLFAWVRDNTRLVPYRGVLRGEIGVLMDRTGNSLDRALLLCSLLESAGHHARLVNGDLPPAQAATLVKSLSARPARPAGALPTENDFLTAYAEQFHVDRRGLQAAQEAAGAAGRRAAESLNGRVERQSATLLHLLPRRSGQEDPEERRDIEALRDHWWAQWNDGARWVDLDPTLRNAAPGTTLTVPLRFVQPATSHDLGDAIQHTVTLRVIVEQWRNGHLREQQALEQALHPSQLIGQRISVSHYPMKWPKNPDTLLSQRDRVAALKQTVLTQTEWLPILTIGSRHVIRSSFTDAGDINQTPLAPVLGSSAQGLGRTLGGMLHSGRITQPAAGSSSGAILTAEWLEYELHRPGYPVRRVRRQLFDLLGPARRASSSPALPSLSERERLERGLALLGESQILPLVADPSQEFVEHLDLETLVANRGVVGTLEAAGRAKAPAVLSANAGKISLGSRRLYGLALARARMRDAAADVYLDRLNILTLHTALAMGADMRVSMIRRIDIVANEVGVRPNAGSDAFLARLRHGVLDTNLEAIFAAPDRDAGCCGGTLNTAALFEAAGGVAWLPVRAGAGAAAEWSRFSDDTRARIVADAREGFDVVSPARPVTIDGRDRTAWWRVDPATGDTLGIGDDGGGDATEQEVLLSQAVDAAVSAGLLLVCLFLMPDPGKLTPVQGAICILAWLTDGTSTLLLEESEWGSAGLIVGIAVEKLLDAGWEEVESREKEGDNESRR